MIDCEIKIRNRRFLETLGLDEESFKDKIEEFWGDDDLVNFLNENHISFCITSTYGEYCGIRTSNGFEDRERADMLVEEDDNIFDFDENGYGQSLFERLSKARKEYNSGFDVYIDAVLH